MSISDLKEQEALQATSHLRSHSQLDHASEEEFKKVVSLVGGRLSYLNQVRISIFLVT